jgi:hypothetical protein
VSGLQRLIAFADTSHQLIGFYAARRPPLVAPSSAAAGW